MFSLQIFITGDTGVMEQLVRSASEDFALPEKVKPETREIYEYWRSKRPAPGLLPGRKHIDPTDIPHLLPSIFLLDVFRADVADGFRLRFRLIGTAITEYLGRDSTGLYLDDVVPNFREIDSYAGIRAAVLRHEIRVQYQPPVARPDMSFVPTERIILPLADNGEVVDMIMGFTQHEVVFTKN